MKRQIRLRRRGSNCPARPFFPELRIPRTAARCGFALRRRLLSVSFTAIVVLAVATPILLGQTRPLPASFQEFLQQYVGKEILLLDGASDLSQTDEADSMQRFVAVLESVDDQEIVVRRYLSGDKRSLSYALANIRRITYLFNGRRYRRIVVETR